MIGIKESLMIVKCALTLILAISPRESEMLEQVEVAKDIIMMSDTYNDQTDLLAIAAIESRYMKGLKSSMDAQGVFQIREIANVDVNEHFKLKLDRYSYADNLRIGKLYWKLIGTRYSDLTERIIAYNAGHSWVIKFRKTGHLPKETVNYIKKFNKLKRLCNNET